MNFSNKVLNLSRSFAASVKISSRGIGTAAPLFFRNTPCLYAEPLKRKKKIDPAIVRQREERKKKKLEKQIRRLEKNARQLKPIEECEVALQLLDEKLLRQRKINLSAEVLEKRALLEKKWCHYRQKQHLADLQILDRIQFAQQKALDELRKESEDLYQAAIQSDFHLIPFKSSGPVDTPPIDNYDTPDGDYQDMSKKWE